MTDRLAAVAGIHEYPDRLAPGMSTWQIKAISASEALADAGLNWSDVDALVRRRGGRRRGRNGYRGVLRLAP